MQEVGNFKRLSSKLVVITKILDKNMDYRNSSKRFKMTDL